MATDWYMEGPYIKNCSCDPGCPCDFNSYPTKGHCEGMAPVVFWTAAFDWLESTLA